MDTTKLKGLWGKIKDFFKNMSMKLRIILAAVLAVVLIAIVVTVVAVNRRNGTYVQLYENLTTQEAGEIGDYLQSNGFPDFQLVGGTTLMVRADQRDALLGQLAIAGYPKDGSIYGTYWDKVGMLTTSSQEARTYLISTMEKLQAVMRTFTGVRDAIVQITPGEDRTFVLQDNSTETGAFVQLTLQDGYTLTDQQADGIRRLLSKSWEGLSIDNVEIVDQWGNGYIGTDETTSGDAAALQRYMEQYQANRLRTEIINALEVIYGPGNVRVGVNVQVEVDRQYIESTTYHQPDGSYESGGLIGHEIGQYVLGRDGYQLVGGVPGTTTNADIPSYIYNEGQNTEEGDSVGSYYERDNKIDETTEQREVLAPRVTSATIAVTLNEGANRTAALTEEQLRRHVAMAAGLGNMTDEELQGYVSVMLADFYTEPVVEPPVQTLIPPDLLPYVIIGAAALLLVIVLLVVILVLRRKKKKKQQEEDQKIIEEQLGELAVAAGLTTPEGMVDENGNPIAPPPPEGGADIMEINTEKSMELRKAVRQFVQNNPEVAAQMLKTWLRGEDDE